MKQIKTLLTYCYTLIAIAVLFTSCIIDGLTTEALTIEGTEQVEIIIQMPSTSNAKTGPQTYAISEEIDENHIKEIDVLCFLDRSPTDIASYEYRVKGTYISDGATPSEKKFSVTLNKYRKNDGSYIAQSISVFANVRAEIDALGEIGKGTKRDNIYKRLLTESKVNWNTTSSTDFRPLPMWGTGSVNITGNSTTISKITMVRSLARVDVVLDDNVENFKLKEIYIYNSKTKGYITNINTGHNSSITVKESKDFNNPTPLKYEVPNDMQTAFDRSIYIHESIPMVTLYTTPPPSQVTAVVVGGLFDTDTVPSYYRLDFLSVSQATGKTLYDYISRNHQYIMTITSVLDRGYSKPIDAFNSNHIKIGFEVLDWDNGNLNDIEIGETKYLTIEPGGVIGFLDNYEGKQTIYVTTNCEDGFSIPPITYLPGVGGTNWLSVDKTYGIKDVKTPIDVKVTEYIGGTGARFGFLTVKAGRIQLRTTVTQSHNSTLPPARATANDINYNIEALQNNFVISGMDANTKVFTTPPTAGNNGSITVQWKE